MIRFIKLRDLWAAALLSLRCQNYFQGSAKLLCSFTIWPSQVSVSTIGGLRSTQRAEGDANVAKNSHLLAPRAGAWGHHAATASANQTDDQTFNFAESR